MTAPSSIPGWLHAGARVLAIEVPGRPSQPRPDAASSHSHAAFPDPTNDDGPRAATAGRQFLSAADKDRNVGTLPAEHSSPQFRVAASPAQGRSERGGHEAILTTAERSEEHTSELQSRSDLVCRLLLEKKKTRRHVQ